MYKKKFELGEFSLWFEEQEKWLIEEGSVDQSQLCMRKWNFFVCVFQSPTGRVIEHRKYIQRFEGEEATKPHSFRSARTTPVLGKCPAGSQKDWKGSVWIIHF